MRVLIFMMGNDEDMVEIDGKQFSRIETDD